MDLAEMIDRSEEQFAGETRQPYRIHRVGPLEPDQWSRASSPHRLDEILNWSVNVAVEKQSLLSQIASASNGPR